MEGYIRLDQRVLNCEWYKDINTFKVFLHILLKANYESVQRKDIIVPRGAFATSYQELAEETGLSKQNVRTALNRMKSTGELEVKNCGKFSIIVVKNYEEYKGTDKNEKNQKSNVEHRCEISSNTMANTITNTITNTISDTAQYCYYQRFREFEKVAANTITNTVANTMANTVRSAERENLQHTYENVDSLKMFNDFWDVYPRKEHRSLSENEYANLFLDKGRIREEDILEAAKNYAEYCKILNKMNMYIYMAHNWLKKEIWRDYLPENYKKPETPKKKLGTGFTNFEQRDYDFDELERQLLEGQKIKQTI